MFFATISIKNMWARPLRTLFTVLGVATAVGAFISLVGLSSGLENAWINALLERETHLFAVPKGIVDIMSASVDENIGKEMAKIKGIADVSGELVDLLELDTLDLIVVAGWPVGSYLWESVNLLAGTIPDIHNSEGIVLGGTIAKTLSLDVGNVLTLLDEDFVIRGVSTKGSVMRNNGVLLSLKSLQKLTGRIGKVTSFNFRLNSEANEEALKDATTRLSKSFPKFVFTMSQEAAENNSIMHVFKAMSWGTSIVAFIIGFVVIMNTLLMSVMERTREIGVLSAIGWSPSRIVIMVVLEGISITIIGGLFGILFGFAGINAIANFPQMKGLIEPSISNHMIAGAFISAIVLGIIASIYPALRAVLLKPCDALRHE